jgi:hypothetical protein
MYYPRPPQKILDSHPGIKSHDCYFSARRNKVHRYIGVVMKTKVCIFLGLLAGVSQTAIAEQMNLFVNLECSAEKNNLKIIFEPSWNEEEAAESNLLEKNRWNTWDLAKIRVDNKGKYYIEKTKIDKSCTLGSDEYKVEITPMEASGYNPEGFCATRMGANVIVRLNAKKIVNIGIDACTENHDVIESVSINPGRAPEYKKIPASDFYDQ